MATEAAEYFCQQSCLLDPIPGQAHWQTSLVEEAIQATKSTMTALALEHPEVTPEEALARATSAGNTREDVRGYSPLQHALGRAPDIDGRFYDPDFDNLPTVEAERVDKEFGESFARMQSAELNHLKWMYQRRVSRAENAKNRRAQLFVPGTYVCYWRLEPHKGDGRGSYKGIARVLCQETSREGDQEGGQQLRGQVGKARQAPCVWITRAGRLLRCDPQQLRLASDRERAFAELNDPTEMPWTFAKEANKLLPGQFVDLTGQEPPEDWSEARWEGTSTTRRRLTGKQARPGARSRSRTPQGSREEASAPSSSSQAPWDRNTKRPAPPLTQSGGERATKPRREVEDDTTEAGEAMSAAFWAVRESAVEVEVALPAERRKLKRASRNLEAYVCSQIRKEKREVHERRLTPEEQAKFRPAKEKEVKNYVVNAVLETLPPGFRPPKEKVMKMRWVLEWRLDEATGGKEAKARLVILGFMDPEYESRPTTAPTMTRTTRQMLLQLAAVKRMKVEKADVRGAFLQGKEFERELYVTPVPELAAALGITPGEAARLRKAAYGLVEAPIEWYLSICKTLEEYGWRRLYSDPCCWVLLEPCATTSRMSAGGEPATAGVPAVGGQVEDLSDSRVIAAAAGHVDDFLFAGVEGNPHWQAAKKRLQDRYDWKAWEEHQFHQCGVRITQRADFGFSLDQEEYVAEIGEVDISPSRRKDRTAPVTEGERTQMRAVLGASGWRAEQTGVKHAAEVSILRSKVKTATVEDLLTTNKLVHKMRQEAAQKLVIHPHPTAKKLVLVAWSDAAESNRPDGTSTKGAVLGMAPEAILEGQETEVSVMSWKSGKIDRACRSSGAAEARSAVDAEDELFAARFQWSEMLGNVPDLREPDPHVRAVKAAIVIDSKGVYDKCQQLVITPKGKERRVDIELLSFKQGIESSEAKIWWVHGDAQLANSLTKAHEPWQMNLFFSSGQRWRLVYDEKFVSARRRKQEGVPALQAHEDDDDE